MVVLMQPPHVKERLHKACIVWVSFSIVQHNAVVRIPLKGRLFDSCAFHVLSLPTVLQKGLTNGSQLIDFLRDLIMCFGLKINNCLNTKTASLATKIYFSS